MDFSTADVLIIVAILLIIYFIWQRNKKETGTEGLLIREWDQLPTKHMFPADPAYNGVPELKSVRQLLKWGLWQPGSNTFPLQETVYNYEAPIKAQLKPTANGSTIVKLIFSRCSRDHPLVDLFDNAMKEFSDRDELSSYKFVQDYLGEDATKWRNMSLPVIVKYVSPLVPYHGDKSLYGEANPLVYNKQPEYGALADWILNNSILQIN